MITKFFQNDIIFTMENNIKEMFDKIANSYDFLNNLISLGLHKIVKENAISSVCIYENAKILDLCTGTGDLAGIIKNKYKNIHIVGLDISSNMLDIASKKYKNIKFIKGNATNLPFLDNSFDFVVSGFGYRNIQDKEKAIYEIMRVLKKGGKFLQLDFGKSPLMFIFDIIILVFGKIFSKNYMAYKYLVKSKNEFQKPFELIQEFKKAGFNCIKSKNLLFNIISYQIFEK